MTVKIFVVGEGNRDYGSADPGDIPLLLEKILQKHFLLSIQQ
jgi:hypothetical protein